MRQLALATAISAIIASPAFAALSGPNVMYYTSTNTSNGISVAAGATTNVYYVNNASSTASNKTEAAVTLVKSGEWYINKVTGAFTGTLVYGNYKTQTNVTGVPTIDGRQTFTGVTQSFSGTGTWASPTHFTYSYLNGTVNGGGGSVQTQTSSSCANGATSILGKVCTSFATATPSWEGLALNFVFSSASLFDFTGTITGTDTSGSGLSRNTTTINWNISAIDPPIPSVPVPAAAWLFGSGLIGLAGAARRRNKSV
jgi:hypothetical protein